MHVLKKCLHGIDQLNYWVARIVSWAVVVIIAATVYEVIMRYVFNAPTIWVFEFNYLLHGPYFLLIGAYTFAVNGHVNVDIFYGRLKPRAPPLLRHPRLGRPLPGDADLRHGCLRKFIRKQNLPPGQWRTPPAGRQVFLFVDPV